VHGQRFDLRDDRAPVRRIRLRLGFRFEAIHRRIAVL
jgi:hypothetical protein